jgi:hypothetical protein
MAQDPAAEAKCNSVLAVVSPNGESRATVIASPLTGGWGFDFLPRLRRLVAIDGHAGEEIEVETEEGATGYSEAIFTIRGGRPVRMGVPNQFDVFDSYASAGAGVINADCIGAARGEVVETETGMLQHRVTWVTRRFYRAVGTDFILENTTRLRVSVSELERRFPELRVVNTRGIFPTCSSK